MELDRHGVALRSYFRRNLVRGRPQRHLSMLKGHDYTRDASCALPQDALIDGVKGEMLVLPKDRVIAEQLRVADGSSSSLQQPEDAWQEPSLLWRPDTAAATQMPPLHVAPLLDLAADANSELDEVGCETDREAVDEVELAVAAA